MKEVLIKILEFLGLACWIEVSTETPKCTYYFGPFLTKKEAQLEQDGYIEDLNHENAKGISAQIRRFKPTELTIFSELESEETSTRASFFRLTRQLS